MAAPGRRRRSLWACTAQTGAAFIAILVSSEATAQSDGRLEDRLFTDWSPPGIEEFARWDRHANGNSVPTAADEKMLARKVKDARTAIDRGGATETRVKLAERYADLLFDLADAQRARELENANEKNPADHKESTATMQRAVEAYRSLFDRYPKFRTKLALQVRLSTLLARTGSPNALPSFLEVIKAKRKTPYGDRALLGIAEVLVAAGRLEEARRYFETAQPKGPIVGAYASWRLAWIAGGQKTSGISAANPIARLKKLQNERCENPETAETKFVCAEARRDLIVAFADAGRLSDAKSHFGESDREAWSLASERFGTRRLAGGKARDAADALNPVVAQGKERQRAPQTHALFARSLASAGDGAGACRALNAMVTAYTDKNSDWAQDHEKSLGTARDVTTNAMRTMMIEAWTIAHSSTASGNARVSGLATGNCVAALYLASFPQADDVPTVRLAYAASLADAGNTLEAARQYYIASGDKRTADDDKHRAAQRMIVLARQSLATVPRRGINSIGTLAQAVPLSPQKKMWVDAVDRFGSLFSDESSLPDLRYDAALLYAEEGNDAAAIRGLDQITRVHAGSGAAAASVRLILTLHRHRNAWDALVVAAKEYLNRTELAQHGLGQELKTAWRDGMWFKAEQLAANKKPIEAAVAYQAFQREFPLDPSADVALSKAAAAYLSEGRGSAGIEACESLISTYRSSSLRATCEWSTASVREQMVEFEEAGRAYERFATDYPNDVRSMDALSRAARLYRDGGNSDMSAKIWGRIAQGAPATLAGEAWLRIGELREKGEEIGAAVEAYQKAAAILAGLRPDDAAYGQAKAAALTTDRIDETKGRAALGAVTVRLAALRGNGAAAARDAAAEAHLKLGARVLEEASNWAVSWVDLPTFNRSRTELERRVAAGVAGLERVLVLGDTKSSGRAHILLGDLYERAVVAFRAPPEDPEMSPEDRAKAVTARETFLLNARTKMLAHWRAAEHDSRPGPLGDRVRDSARVKLARHDTSGDATGSEGVLAPSFAQIGSGD